MPIQAPTGFLDITNATLRTSNIEAENFKLNGGNIYVTTEFSVVNENVASNVIIFSNVTTGLVTDGNVGVSTRAPDANLHVVGNVHVADTTEAFSTVTGAMTITGGLGVAGNVHASRFYGDGSNISGISSNLDQIVNNGNVTSSTVQFSNVTTGLVTTANVEVGGNLTVSGDLTVSGNVTTDYFVGDGSNITGIASTLQAITDSEPGANVTSNTIQFSNVTTGLVTTANVEVGGNLTVSGDLTVSGNVTTDYFVGDGSNITGIASTLQAITDSEPGANVTSNTIQFTNVITGLVTTANVEVGGELSVSGNVVASGDVTASSDRRLKTDIKRIGGALNKVRTLGGYTFTKNDNPSTGLIAQEVLEVLPEAVHGTEETYYSVAYGNMVGILIEAIKELSDEVKELKEKIG